MDEAYLESMTENLQEIHSRLMGNPASVTDEEIERLVKSVDESLLYTLSFTFGLRLYRARYNDGFDDTEVNQFSYIHDPAIHINQLRYNLEGEKVLYTGTSPDYAFEEIRSNDVNKPTQFYLSIWEPKQDADFSFQCVYDPTQVKAGTTAQRFTDIIRSKIPVQTSFEYFLKSVGLLMEINNNDYRFSAQLASKIFTKNDCLISISRKSNFSALNLTFNQAATDTKLDLLYVLLCDVPTAPKPFFNVHKVGKNIKGKIVWFDFRLREIQNLGCSQNLISAMQANPNIIGPSSIKSIDETTHRMKIEVDNQFSFDYVLY